MFVAFGLCTELCFTGVSASWAGSFRGQVSLLMVPVYLLAYVAIGPALSQLERRGWTRLTTRVGLGVALVYGFEWSFGLLYGALGLRPWHYDHGWASDFSGGCITLYYLPAWALFVLLAERVWRIVSDLAPHADRAARLEIARVLRRNEPERSRA
ncbi:MAG: hypothetical protein ACQGVK_00635 [Myxococcota bacterium]